MKTEMLLSRRDLLSLAAVLPAVSQPRFTIPAPDEELLEDVSRRCALYFWEQADPHTGLTLDRARNDGEKTEGRTRDVASMASTGFALTALCIACERKWRDPNEIAGRVRTTLRHLSYDQSNESGWYYHFVDARTGERVWRSEVSSIDTALLLAGVLTVAECFKTDAEIVRMAKEIFARVDFRWMYDSDTGLLRMGWTPETGFLRHSWVDYRENTILNILAIASPSFPLPVRTWYQFQRDPVRFEDYRYVGGGPIFTHQFSQAWLDLRGLRDGDPFHLDYFQNSVVATAAHRAFCLSLRTMFPGYSDNLWGVTPSDSEIGYVTWGGELSRLDMDGTVVPCASAGSLMFTPALSLPALRTMYKEFGRRIYGRYGFSDAFHPLTGWTDTEVLGINQGITLLSAENLRTGRVWNWFSGQPDIRGALSRVFQRRSS